MSETNLLERITIDANQCGGRPCIRGMRIRVIDILELLAAGQAPDEILSDYPYLEAEDIAASLLYAARQIDHPILAAWVNPDHGVPDAAGGLGSVWIDAQLPPVMARWLRKEYSVDAYHVDDLGLLRAPDPKIFMAARNEKESIVVVTKDDDFLHLLRQHGPPPQVVWMRCGNVKNPELRRIILDAWPDIARFIAAGEPLLEVRARSGA